MLGATNNIGMSPQLQSLSEENHPNDRPASSLSLNSSASNNNLNNLAEGSHHVTNTPALTNPALLSSTVSAPVHTLTQPAELTQATTVPHISNISQSTIDENTATITAPPTPPTKFSVMLTFLQSLQSTPALGDDEIDALKLTLETHIKNYLIENNYIKNENEQLNNKDNKENTNNNNTATTNNATINGENHPTVSRSLTESSNGTNTNNSTIPSRPSPLTTKSLNKRTIAVNIDENDRNILRKAMTMNDVITLLTNGVNFTAYFPINETNNTNNQHSKINSAELILFYSNKYQQNTNNSNTNTANNTSGVNANDRTSHSANPSQDANDLGRGPIIAWCEPNVTRYLIPDQALAIEHINEIYVGKNLRPHFLPTLLLSAASQSSHPK